MPLILSQQGWPGSVFELYKVLPMLTDPARVGGDPCDSFTIVAPSLPGYVFSFKPGQKHFSIENITKVFATLMIDVMGSRTSALRAVIARELVAFMWDIAHRIPAVT